MNKKQKRIKNKPLKYLTLGNSIFTPMNMTLPALKKLLGGHFRVVNFHRNFCIVEFFIDSDLKIINYLIMYNFPPSDKLFDAFYKWLRTQKGNQYNFYKDEYNLIPVKGDRL